LPAIKQKPMGQFAPTRRMRNMRPQIHSALCPRAYAMKMNIFRQPIMQMTE